MNNPRRSNYSPGSVTLLNAEMRSSNFMQLELVRGIAERGASIRMPARGFSMSPFIQDGDMLVIASSKNRKPRFGDVVAFTLPGADRLAIHRIIAKHKNGWLVRGDNSSQADGVVPGEAILGVVTQIERHGRTVRFGLGIERIGIAFFNRINLLPTLKNWINLPRRLLLFLRRRAP
jgi:signal peptidase I